MDRNERKRSIPTPPQLSIYPFHHYQNSSYYAMSSAGFTEFIQPTTPPKSPSIPSVPNATPDDDSISSISFAPQLAIRSIPLPDKDSTIDYEHETPHSDDEVDEAPVSFVPNDPES